MEKSAVGPFFAGAGGGLVFPQAAQQVAGAEVWNTWRVTVKKQGLSARLSHNDY
ncbi:MAG: hypothetical protein V9G15_02740 [Dermatophilaceae bacterium]